MSSVPLPHRSAPVRLHLVRYVYLSELQDRNETIFYRVLMDNIEHMGAASGGIGK